MTYHSDIVKQRFLRKLYSPLMNLTLASMDAIVATSPVYAKTSNILCQKKLRKKVCVVPLGIVEQEQNKNCDMGVFRRLNFSEGETYFLFLGVLRYYKGVNFLLQAAKNIKSKVIIAGDGPEMQSLENSAPDNVLFAGEVSSNEKAALLENCRALVLPSHLRSEAFGMVLVEASIVARPMITCEVGSGTSFVNLHNETGYVVPAADPQALGKALERLEADEKLAVQFGLRARERYDELFSKEALGASYLEIYKKILRERSNQSSSL